jgi:hypothetical protein
MFGNGQTKVNSICVSEGLSPKIYLLPWLVECNK